MRWTNKYTLYTYLAGRIYSVGRIKYIFSHERRKRFVFIYEAIHTLREYFFIANTLTHIT